MLTIQAVAQAVAAGQVRWTSGPAGRLDADDRGSAQLVERWRQAIGKRASLGPESGGEHFVDFALRRALHGGAMQRGLALGQLFEQPQLALGNGQRLAELGNLGLERATRTVNRLPTLAQAGLIALQIAVTTQIDRTRRGCADDSPSAGGSAVERGPIVDQEGILTQQVGQQ